ncbi:hypothetical protein PAMP_019019 [Pampus punctatissimus]
MVIKTESPSVKAGLGSQQKLHCQFSLDHKGPDVTMEWYWQHQGERTRLFSHNSRSRQTQGTGVGLKSLAGGDASYTLPFTKMSSEGTYVCSVSVMPLFASLDISLHIEEPPRVSLNVGSTLSLQEGAEQKVVCDAELLPSGCGDSLVPAATRSVRLECSFSYSAAQYAQPQTQPGRDLLTVSFLLPQGFTQGDGQTVYMQRLSSVPASAH